MNAWTNITFTESAGVPALPVRSGRRLPGEQRAGMAVIPKNAVVGLFLKRLPLLLLPPLLLSRQFVSFHLIHFVEMTPRHFVLNGLILLIVILLILLAMQVSGKIAVARLVGGFVAEKLRNKLFILSATKYN